MSVTNTGLPAAAGRAARTRNWRLRHNLPLYIMLLPAIVGLLLFNYYPMYGVRIAFQNYDPLLGFARSPWVGLANFRRVFSLPDTWIIARNTLGISLGKIVLGQVTGVTFALLLNEVRSITFRRGVQSLTYLPHFLSWLLFGGIMLDILSLQGIVNNALALVGLPRLLFLGNPTAFPLVLVVTDTWKEFGWNAIIYLAALTAIDPTLYEAAAVDGAGRWARLRHITFPGLVPTMILLVTLSLGWVLSAGFEQILVLYNPAVYSTGDVIDTYVYRSGLLSFQYSLATAVGLIKGVVGLVLVTLSFRLARRYANYRIF